MMYRKVGFAELAAAVIAVLQENTSYPVYDAVPEDADSPLIFVEVIGKQDASAKILYKEIFTVQIHVIAKPAPERTELYEMIHQVEEAMTAPLVMPDGVECLLQTETGVQSLQMDETGEWHAGIGYELMVSYGLKIK